MMRIHPPCRLPALRPLLLSLVVVPTFASKILHIFLHRRGASSSAFFLYMPSFFFTDFLVSILAWLALSKLPGIWGIVGTVAVAVLSYVRSFLLPLFLYFAHPIQMEWNGYTDREKLIIQDLGSRRCLVPVRLLLRDRRRSAMEFRFQFGR